MKRDSDLGERQPTEEEMKVMEDIQKLDDIKFRYVESFGQMVPRKVLRITPELFKETTR